MFDIGFWELAVIALVALLVIGPERLPKLAHTAGLWLGRMRHFVASVKADIDRELKAEELRKVLEQQQQSNPLHEIIEESRESLEVDEDLQLKGRSHTKPVPEAKQPAVAPVQSSDEPARGTSTPPSSNRPENER